MLWKAEGWVGRASTKAKGGIKHEALRRNTRLICWLLSSLACQVRDASLSGPWTERRCKAVTMANVSSLGLRAPRLKQRSTNNSSFALSATDELARVCHESMGTNSKMVWKSCCFTLCEPVPPTAGELDPLLIAATSRSLRSLGKALLRTNSFKLAACSMSTEEEARSFSKLLGVLSMNSLKSCICLRKQERVASSLVSGLS